MEELINEIIELEWEQFQAVHNEGGKADCQNNRETFIIMRKSQVLCWNLETLQSYKKDLILAKERNWNLLTEKYARMMKNTDPVQYKELEANLPFLSKERIEKMEEIVKQFVIWQEEYASQYPHLAQNGRYIHSYEDTKWNTSFETYTRGEISTYSNQTLELFDQMIEQRKNENRNICIEIMEQEVKFYGYSSIKAAEENYKNYIN